MPFKLNERHDLFCRSYLVHWDGQRAAREAGYSRTRAKQTAWELLARPEIQNRLAELTAARKRRLDRSGDEIVRQWWEMLEADANELSEFRRTCCRYCHGADHRYQRTTSEMESARAVHENLKRKKKAVFDEAGGLGWDARKDPHSECPECFGEGISRAFFKDTRHLSPEARRLYAGVRSTRDGIEVKAHDQEAVRANLAKHYGLLKDKVEHSFDLSALNEEALDALEFVLKELAQLGGSPGGEG